MTSVRLRDPRQRSDGQRLRRAVVAAAVALGVAVVVATPMAVRVSVGYDQGGATMSRVQPSDTISPTTPSPTAAPVHVLSAVALHQDKRVCSGGAPQPM